MDIRFKDINNNRMNVDINIDCNTFEICDMTNFKGWNPIHLDDAQLKNLRDFLNKVLDK